jgi:YbbR domain-containing protein
MTKKNKLFHLTKNSLKLLSLLLAIVVWYSIKENINFASELPSVPVVINLPDNWAVLEKSVDTVKVQFRGTREDIRDLIRDPVRIEYTFSGDLDRGEKEIELDLRHVITTTGAKPIYIKPSKITLKLDREGSRILPIKADLQGSLPDGINVAEVTVEPNQVEVFGPESRLGEIEFLRTDPVELEGKAQSFMSRVALVSPSRLWDARLEPDAVNVKIEIIDAIVMKERVVDNVQILALFGGTLPRSVTMKPAVITVTLSGTPEKVDALDPKSIIAFVNCSNFKREKNRIIYDLPVQLNVPAGISVDRIEPETVKASIE